MSRGPDASTLLQRAFQRDARAAGCEIAVAGAASTRWASATFTGAQHRLTLSAADEPALNGWLAGLREADLPLCGHLLADVTVARIARADGRAVADVEALTVET